MSKLKLKIIFTILCFIFIISSFFIYQTKLHEPFLSDSQISNFENLIKEYPSYNKDKLKLYYEVYSLSNNLNEALNKVNYENFFSLNVQNDIDYYLKGNNHILVNPKYTLSSTYVPNNLVSILEVEQIKRKDETIMLEEMTYNAYKQMFEDAKKHGLKLVVFSGYRSFEKQLNIYINNPDPRYVARAGHSEHQTGLAIDISTLDTGLTDYFEQTNEFKYLRDNAYKYGFILRYPKNKENITGYNYEPWHYRYVGIEVATFIYENKLTLEEYLYYYTILNRV